MPSLQAYTGVWGKAQVVHLLKRTMFGSKPSDVSYFIAKSMSASVDELLTVPTAKPSPPLNYYEGIDVSGTPFHEADNIPKGQTWVNGTYGDGTTNFFRGESLKSWWIQNLMNQSRSIEEKMMVFWHNHFVSELQSGGGVTAYYRLLELLRTHALGNFKSMMLDTSKNAYMLFYLNGYLNTKFSPDENFSRELQELFGVGKGPESLYTEQDVREAARVMTGHSLDWTSQTYAFRDTLHDPNSKTFSAFYGNKVITGKSGSQGADELNELVDMIIGTDECAKFVCRKIYRFFVDHKIDNAIETDIIIPLANMLRNGYEIKPVMEKLLKSQHFYDTITVGSQIKSPVDLVVGLGREFGAPLPPTSDITKYYQEILYTYYYNAAIMQQALGDPPNVAGWPAWYQTPQYYQLWANSDTLPKRVNFALAMIYNVFAYPADLLKFAAEFSSVANPGAFIDDVIDVIYSGVTVSTTYKALLKSATLLSGQAQDHYWTDAWNDYLNNPTDAAKKNTVLSRLRSLFDVLTATSEYQLC